MKIRLLFVGKPRGKAECALHDDYAQRIQRFGVGYESSFVPEVRAGGRYDDDHVRKREGASLLERLSDRGVVIALDRSGEVPTTEELARRLERWTTPRGTFVIGGPLGLHRVVLERADSVWSLSPLTYPHELVRVLVAEQLYRALTINRGVPYHK